MSTARWGRDSDLQRPDPYPAADEAYRAILIGKDPEGGDHTIIVTRQGGAVWLTLAGSIRATAVLRGPRVEEVVTMLREADEAEPRPRCEKPAGITRVRGG